MSSDRWKEARCQLLDNMLRAKTRKPHNCQRCLKKRAVIRCAECMSKQYYCCDYDINQHQSRALHNRTSMFHGFHMPLPPTVVVKTDAEGRYSHHTCGNMYNIILESDLYSIFGKIKKIFLCLLNLFSFCS